jgi:hypothetical protein
MLGYMAFHLPFLGYRNATGRQRAIMIQYAGEFPHMQCLLRRRSNIADSAMSLDCSFSPSLQSMDSRT